MKKKLSEQFNPDKSIEEMILEEKKMFIKFYENKCGNISWLQYNQDKYNIIKKQLKNKKL